MSNKKDCTISFRETSELNDTISAIADSKGIGKSSVLRMLIREHLAADHAKR